MLKANHPDEPIPHRRTVEKWKEELTDRGKSRPVAPREDWKPWSGDESAAESAFLNRLSEFNRSINGQMLSVGAAQWAKRLMVALKDLDPQRQLWIVAAYEERELSSIVLGLDAPLTDDLDQMIAYAPWTKDGREVYLAAIDGGMVFPLMGYLSPKLQQTQTPFSDFLMNRFFMSELSSDAGHWQSQIVDRLKWNAERNTKESTHGETES